MSSHPGVSEKDRNGHVTEPGQQLGSQPREAKLALAGLARALHVSQGFWQIPSFPPGIATQSRSEDLGLSQL